MDEVRAMNEIEAYLPQEKIHFINDAHQKELQYWKSENEKKQLTDLAPLRVFLASKDAVKNEKNVGEIIFNLKNQYSPHNEERRTFIKDIPSQEDQFTFEEIFDSLKTFSNENMSLKNKVLLGGWISTAAEIFRFRRDKNVCRKDLPGRFEDWMYRECGMKKQMIYNYKILYKLIRSAPKLINCRVNMTYFVKKIMRFL